MVKVFALHKSGSMFLYEYFKLLSKLNNLNHYSVNNNPKNQNEYNKVNGCICPIRDISEDEQYDINETYIFHFRNPIDTLISEYYSFGFTHILEESWSDSNKRNKIRWERPKEKREYIQSITIDQYCINEYNVLLNRYENMINFINLYYSNGNIIISKYDHMFYNFKQWNKDICKALNINGESKLYNQFKSEFENVEIVDNNKIITGEIKTHRRNGTSNQYLNELNTETVNILESVFSNILTK
jgi:hypothetical protein